MNDENPLIEIATHVRHHARREKVAVVFDLDSTLFCVSPRTQHILRQLGNDRAFADRHAQAAQVLRSIEVLPTDYSVRQVLARTGLPFSSELAEDVRSFWRRHFFSNLHLDKDILYPSAKEYVTHLHDLGARIIYLTGRNEISMRRGTIETLRRSGFPEFTDSQLFMKPSDAQTDEHFKLTKFKELSPQFDHIWFFENEPLIINEIHQALPQIHIVFVNSTHSGKAMPPQGLRTVAPDYRVPG